MTFEVPRAQGPDGADIRSDARKAARAAHLRYVSDAEPGISRQGAPENFRYVTAQGRVLKDKAALSRIASLVIPPAWRDVWIARDASAHLQATGRDAKGRKQYRYHPEFAAMRGEAKYAHLADFAQSLPRLRARLARDLALPGLPREKILAAIVSLLQQTLIRVGNEDYARTNKSFGLTTLRNRHVKVHGPELRFMFQGKSGRKWSLALRDPRVAKVVRACQELPGQHLFEYRGEDGGIHAVSSSDVNAYLREISGREITAKDFRTWSGTVNAAMGLAGRTDDAVKPALRDVVADVALALGNTVAVCRKCYIHPAILEDFEKRRFALALPQRGKKGLSRAECAVLQYLQKRA